MWAYKLYIVLPTFKITIMKREVKFYQTQFSPFTGKNLLPKLTFSKNVQGWFFTRNWTITLFRFACTISTTVTKDLDVDRNLAHDQNVSKYMA